MSVRLLKSYMISAKFGHAGSIFDIDLPLHSPELSRTTKLSGCLKYMQHLCVTIFIKNSILRQYA